MQKELSNLFEIARLWYRTTWFSVGQRYQLNALIRLSRVKGDSGCKSGKLCHKIILISSFCFHRVLNCVKRFLTNLSMLTGVLSFIGVLFFYYWVKLQNLHPCPHKFCLTWDLTWMWEYINQTYIICKLYINILTRSQRFPRWPKPIKCSKFPLKDM